MKLDFHRALLLYFLSLIIYNQYYKLGFVVLELALLCGRYLELVETIQPPLCKGRGTTKWWKDCFGRHFRLYKIYSIYDVGNEHCSFLYL